MSGQNLCMNDYMMLAALKSSQLNERIPQKCGSDTNDTMTNTNMNSNQNSRSHQLQSEYDLSISMSVDTNINSTGFFNSLQASSSFANESTILHDSPQIPDISNHVVELNRIANKEIIRDEIICQICKGVLINPKECVSCESCFC